MKTRAAVAWEAGKPLEIEEVDLQKPQAGEVLVQIIAKRTLRQFWERHARAEIPLRAWYSIVDRSEWQGPSDVKTIFGTTVDFIGDNRLIFDIGGNKYRLVVHVSYAYKRVLVKFIGTHAEYDKIDPETM